MAQTKDLIVTSTNIGGTKSYIRIGDLTGPADVSTTGSTIQFLGDLSSIDKTFDNQGNASAFRIRHDTVNGALIFQGKTNSVQHSLLQFQDQGTVKFTAPVTFDAIDFNDIFAEQITSSYLYIGSGSRFDGNITITGSSKIIFTGSYGTASLYYDRGKLRGDGLASGWKTVYKVTTPIAYDTDVTVYTTSVNQTIQNINNLSVYLNGDLLLQSGSSCTEWDYKAGSAVNKIKFNYPIPADDIYLTYVYNASIN